MNYRVLADGKMNESEFIQVHRKLLSQYQEELIKTDIDIAAAKYLGMIETKDGVYFGGGELRSTRRILKARIKVIKQILREDKQEKGE